MPIAVVVTLAAALALPASASGVDGPGVVSFPNATILPRQDKSARGYLSPAISTLLRPGFCWELSLATRSQPLFAYLRRAGTGRIVATIDTRDNHIPTMPWSGSGSYSGCTPISRADERAFLRRPALYYLDVRTQTARHAAVAHPRGPHL
ncbi:MAG TPA: hypothetical protein VF101_00160 [Gaiellaceae bacterium]